MRFILKGHSQLRDFALDSTFASLKSIYLNTKSNLRIQYIWKSALILPSVLFDPQFFTENLFLSKLLPILLHYILSYLVENSIQRNMNRRGEKRVGTRWENSPSFIKTTREMNQWHWWANNRYIYLENGWKRLHIFEKSSILDHEPSTQYNHSDFMQFLTSTDVRIGKYSSMFGFPGKIHWWILNGISKMSVLMWLRFQLVTVLVQLHKVCLEYSGCAFVSHTSCDKKSAKKWYLVRMCISWLCPFEIYAGLENNLSHFTKNQEYRTDRLNGGDWFQSLHYVFVLVDNYYLKTTP